MVCAGAGCKRQVYLLLPHAAVDFNRNQLCRDYFVSGDGNRLPRSANYDHERDGSQLAGHPEKTAEVAMSGYTKRREGSNTPGG